MMHGTVLQALNLRNSIVLRFVPTVLAHSFPPVCVALRGCPLLISCWWVRGGLPLFVHTNGAALNVSCRSEALFIEEKDLRGNLELFLAVEQFRAGHA